jgi:xanthine dehydrogenase accessory factor
MNSVDWEVLNQAARWLETGHRVTLVTVVGTWGSSPRPVGSMLAVRGDGRLVGSVSGGCVEDDLIERIGSGSLASLRPQVLKYGVTREENERFGLPCGGILQLVAEPLRDAPQIELLLRDIAAGRIVARTLNLPSGHVELRAAGTDEALGFDGTTLTTIHGPRWRLLIIGANQVSRYLAPMALALDYRVAVCDPREQYAQSWKVAGVEIIPGMPDDAVHAMRPDPRSAIVCLTHDPKLDDMALLEALKSQAFYVGALGSRGNNERRRARLALFDLKPAEIARLHGPIGLDIGSRTPPEIAISILAEMTAVRRGIRAFNRAFNLVQPAPAAAVAAEP